mmetsp:Transcript_34122/g.89721  ORF Transcript_34122/g.89721 Transcript_34122/m.89721 type:complete len:278 (-) Transcript_34122:157-990(-)|eukprot:CAMPEP_0115840942 /NCGR_PEP_ID=MMETSP0287-20121206/7032_1 /TAXON_ID=412157 /ORGANISM="Chrysochromulina rotalis, Strain UIO044" /LENGTH=277 /DNA_ID=CAMNT_0003294571 /DNA_START=300 /DNA_END=1133 /DNA_ORIENTATION=+
MPYVAGNLDEHTAAALSDAAARIASGAPLQVETRPFHVTIIGSLHIYASDQIVTATTLALGCVEAPLVGRFVRWEVTRRSLRVVVECCHGFAQLQSHIQSSLPRGRPWIPAHVTIGYIDDIPVAQHADFLRAVQAYFPIVSESIFSLPVLEFENDVAEHPNPPVWQLRSDPCSKAHYVQGNAEGLKSNATPPRAHGSPIKKAVRGKQLWNRAKRAPLAVDVARDATGSTSAASETRALAMDVDRSLKPAIKKRSKARPKPGRVWSRLSAEGTMQSKL